MENWLEECKRNGGNKLIPVLVGNKSDLKNEVSRSMIEGFIEKYKYNYYELSNKDLDSIYKFFSDFASYVNDLKPKDRNR